MWQLGALSVPEEPILVRESLSCVEGIILRLRMKERGFSLLPQRRSRENFNTKSGEAQ